MGFEKAYEWDLAVCDVSRGVEARKYQKECARARSRVRQWSKAVMTVVQLVDVLAA